jgi:hypothetical protein
MLSHEERLGLAMHSEFETKSPTDESWEGGCNSKVSVSVSYTVQRFQDTLRCMP